MTYFTKRTPAVKNKKVKGRKVVAVAGMVALPPPLSQQHKEHASATRAKCRHVGGGGGEVGTRTIHSLSIHGRPDRSSTT